MNIVAKFASNPQHFHYVAVGHIFCYLASTADLAICYDGKVRKLMLGELEGHADADYAGDVIDQKSRTGTVLLLNNALIV